MEHPVRSRGSSSSYLCRQLLHFLRFSSQVAKFFKSHRHVHLDTLSVSFKSIQLFIQATLVDTADLNTLLTLLIQLDRDMIICIFEQ